MGEEAPSLLESLKASGEITADSPTLKALAQGVGAMTAGPLGAILSGWAIGRGEQVAKERQRAFIEALAKDLTTLEGQVVRKDYFATDEGYDLLSKALDEARRTRSQKKRELYARILRGAIVDFERREYSPEEYLHLISDFTLQELDVARSLYLANPKQGESWTAWKTQVCAAFKINKDDLPMILSRIQATGLIRAVPSMRDEVGRVWIETETDDLYYEVTSSYKRMMRFLGIGQHKELRE